MSLTNEIINGLRKKSPLCLSEIARGLDVSVQCASDLVNKMQKEKLVRVEDKGCIKLCFLGRGLNE